MSWREAKRPDEVFGTRDKPFRFSGRSSSYKEYLNVFEQDDLTLVLQILLVACTMSDSEMHVLLVGSAAESSNHTDIDMLVCSSPDRNRIQVAKDTLDQFRQFPFKVDHRRAKGSVGSFVSDLFTPSKIFALAQATWNTFDISFVGIGSGDWDDVLDFHSRTKLSHSVIG